MTDEESKRLLDRIYGRKKTPSVKDRIENVRKEFNRDELRAPDGKWIRGASPAEIDTKLFPVLDRIAHHEQNVNHLQDQLDNGRKEIRGTFSNKKTVRVSVSDRERPRMENAIASSRAEIAKHEKVAGPLEAEFNRRGGWPRYIVSVSANGHLHKRHCHTLTPGRSMV